jgi:hypothetical protein
VNAILTSQVSAQPAQQHALRSKLEVTDVEIAAVEADQGQHVHAGGPTGGRTQVDDGLFSLCACIGFNLTETADTAECRQVNGILVVLKIEDLVLATAPLETGAKAVVPGLSGEWARIGERHRQEVPAHHVARWHRIDRCRALDGDQAVI